MNKKPINWRRYKFSKVNQSLLEIEKLHSEKHSSIRHTSAKYFEEKDIEDFKINDNPILEKFKFETSPNSLASSPRGSIIIPKHFAQKTEINKELIEKSKKSIEFFNAAKQKFEVERAVNLYYHLHSPKHLFPQENSPDVTSVRYETVQKQLRGLPSIKKYKLYLKENHLRFPSFLQTTNRPKLPYLNN
ncbi:unnamed protein product [Blepharisma stoltei]|uniref:Uncharacterized protein n=1 Tax=Blepharisma stoltei TaxID=1481888 RepID=A0AAU9IZE5_9CILI|nr:unnamed protein product [Blepharisma stoltei]